MKEFKFEFERIAIHYLVVGLPWNVNTKSLRGLSENCPSLGSQMANGPVKNLLSIVVRLFKQSPSICTTIRGMSLSLAWLALA